MCGAEQVAVRGEQLGAPAPLICLHPGQLPPLGPRRLQSGSERQEFVAMRWESSFPPAVGSAAARSGGRGSQGARLWLGSSQGAPSRALSPGCVFFLGGVCGGQGFLGVTGLTRSLHPAQGCGWAPWMLPCAVAQTALCCLLPPAHGGVILILWGIPNPRGIILTLWGIPNPRNIILTLWDIP